jgi:hypothetical protein
MSRRSATFGILGGLSVAAIIVAAPATAHAWGRIYMPPPGPARSMAPDQSWLQDVPERRGAHARGKVAVFVIQGDDVYQPVRAAVVKLLRRRGLNVTASLRPVDTASQYRELSQSLNLAVYVDGEVTGEGAHQSAVIRLRSGMSGQHIASARFSGPTKKIVSDMNSKLWTRIGPTVTRACTGAKHPRQLEREPMRIEAGSPDDDDGAPDGG